MKDFFAKLSLFCAVIMCNSLVFACETKIVDEELVSFRDPSIDAALREINKIAFLFDEGHERLYLDKLYKIINGKFELKHQNDPDNFFFLQKKSIDFCEGKFSFLVGKNFLKLLEAPQGFEMRNGCNGIFRLKNQAQVQSPIEQCCIHDSSGKHLIEVPLNF